MNQDRAGDRDIPATGAAGIATTQRIGRFEVSSILGSGAFGDVYLARDTQLNREVALKVPKAGAFQAEQEAERFIREARAAAGLQHQNICPVHDVLEENGQPVIVMSYVRGKRLDQLVEAGKTISQRQAAGLVRKLAKALQYAHEQGIIHRDLKPANIILSTEQKEPVVMDFGLSRAGTADDSGLTRTGQLLGSPAYMSPEQAEADPRAVGPQSDIYSLGVILYELLCGERPFSGSVGEVLAALLYVEPPPPSSRRAGIDPQLEAICLRAIAKKPANRYASMQDFARALAGFLRTGTSESGDIESQSEASQTMSQMASSVQTATDRSKIPLATKRQQLQRLLQTDRRARWGLGAAFVTAMIVVLAIVFNSPTGEKTADTKEPAAEEIGNPQAASAEPAPDTADPGAAEKQAGKIAAAAPRADISVNLTPLQTLASDSSCVWDVAFAPDGKTLSAANDGKTVKLWDVTNGTLQHTLDDFPSAVQSVAYSQDGKMLATGRSNQSGMMATRRSNQTKRQATGTPNQAMRGNVTVWDPQTHTEMFSLTDSKSVWSLRFSPDGRRLIAGLGSSMPEEMRQRVMSMPGGSGRALEARNEMFKRYQWGAVIIWDVGSRKALVAPPVDSPRIRRMAASDDGSILATCGFKGELSIRDATTAEISVSLRDRVESDYDITGVAVSADGKLLAAAHRGGFIVLSLPDQQEVLRNDGAGDVGALLFSPDGRILVSGHTNASMQIWDLSSGKRLLSVPVDAGRIEDLEFSPDGNILAAATADPGNVVLWKFERDSGNGAPGG